MNKIIKEDVSVGSGIIGMFERMPQKLERVFAEFIDNSTQSYNDHKEKLINLPRSSVCRISITWDDEKIVILDNAFGMNHDEFRHALKLNNPRDNYSANSRSQYGMGLKTAAAYLGAWYSIETTMYGSTERYSSEIDIDYFKENDPNTIDNRITDALESDHYTKITIKKLYKSLTNGIDNVLRKKLALIYCRDMSKGDLEIYLNGRPIIVADPELRINKETGTEYLNSFDDYFEFQGRKYEYQGWVGILKTASTDDAGFTLSQYNRGIRLNYRPSEIFGKSNSFQYQRVVGEIQLNDKKWKISFNKDNFIWDDGLEKAFIDSLKSNKEVKEIHDIAGALRKESGDIKPVVKQEDVKKSINELKEKYDNLKDVTKINVEKIIDNQPIVLIKPEEKIESNIINIRYESMDYSFDVQIKNQSTSDNWLTIQKKDQNNSYYVIINGVTKYFADYNKKECKKLIVDFAVALALTQLSCVRLGLDFDKSGIMIKRLNDILKNTN